MLRFISLHILAKIEQSNQDLFERQCACQAGSLHYLQSERPLRIEDLVNADYIAGVLTGYRTGS
jgi:hypothetical protein